MASKYYVCVLFIIRIAADHEFDDSAEPELLLKKKEWNKIGRSSDSLTEGIFIYFDGHKSINLTVKSSIKVSKISSACYGQARTSSKHKR